MKLVLPFLLWWLALFAIFARNPLLAIEIRLMLSNFQKISFFGHIISRLMFVIFLPAYALHAFAKSKTTQVAYSFCILFSATPYLA